MFAMCDVILDGVQADAEACGNLTVAEAVAYEMDDSPLRGRQHIWVTGSSSSSRRAHATSLVGATRIYPTPGPKRRKSLLAADGILASLGFTAEAWYVGRTWMLGPELH